MLSISVAVSTTFRMLYRKQKGENSLNFIETPSNLSFFCNNMKKMFNLTCSILQVESVKVKCTLVQELRLCSGHTARRGSRGIALLFF